MTTSMAVQISRNGWVRYSNPSGNCVEARRAENTRAIEIRESECPGHSIIVAEYQWYGFLIAIKAGLYEPRFITPAKVIVPIGTAEFNVLETTLPNWRAFVTGVKADLFDDLPEPVASWRNAKVLDGLERP